MVEAAYSGGLADRGQDGEGGGCGGGGELGADFYEFGGGADDEGGEASGGACDPDFCEGSRELGGVVEGGEGAVVGYEEEGVEGAVAEQGGCGAYAEVFGISACVWMEGVEVASCE